MQRATLFATLQESKRIHLDALFGTGVTEIRVPQFIDWYERVRNPATSPKQDIITYNTCKVVASLNELAAAVQKADVQLV